MNKKGKLYILWTSSDPTTSELMVFMYAKNSMMNNWWNEVNLIIWGGSTKLIKNNIDMINNLKELKAAGVNIMACKRCAEILGMVEQLEQLNITVEYLGTFLTDLIKNNEHLITI